MEAIINGVGTIGTIVLGREEAATANADVPSYISVGVYANAVCATVKKAEIG